MLSFSFYDAQLPFSLTFLLIVELNTMLLTISKAQPDCHDESIQTLLHNPVLRLYVDWTAP